MTFTHPNRLKAKFARGETVVGLSCALGSAQVAEEFAMAGFDYLYIDQQHGLTSSDSLVEMLRAIARTDTTPLVRVAKNDAGRIGQALDAGAEGVIIPMIDTAADAALAVASCRYFPEGNRSWGPIRAHYGLGADPAVVNAEVLCLVMIETEVGLDNLDEILAVAGVDGIYIGPADLGVTLGAAPLSFERATDPRPLEAIARIVAACVAAKKIVGTSGTPAVLAASGFTMVTAALDVMLLRSALAQVSTLT